MHLILLFIPTKSAKRFLTLSSAQLLFLVQLASDSVFYTAKLTKKQLVHNTRVTELNNLPS